MSSDHSDQELQSIWQEDSPQAFVLPEQLLLESIASGELDEHLVAIADAVEARRGLLHTVESATALATFCIGDAVRINRRIRPRYLTGEFGTITDLDDHWVTVCLLRPIGRFTNGEIRCPPLSLENVSRATSRAAA